MKYLDYAANAYFAVVDWISAHPHITLWGAIAAIVWALV